MLYRKLEARQTINDSEVVKLKDVFPELSKRYNSSIKERFENLGFWFYTEKTNKTSFLVRLTLPFALILFVLMFISIPFYYIVTGYWGYRLGKSNPVYNWVHSLCLC